MECPHCGARWDVPGSKTQLTACPFCKKSLAPEEKQPTLDSLEAVLARIIEAYGVEKLDDPKATIGLLMDLAPQLTKEAQALLYFKDARVLPQLAGMRKLPEKEQYVCYRRVYTKMVDEQLIREDIARMICDAYAKALHITLPAQPKRENKEPKQAKAPEAKKVSAAEELYRKALSLEYGITEGINYAKALGLYQTAALQGHLNAMCRLAYLCEVGPATLRDISRATLWYEKAAVLGDTGAQLAMLRLTNSNSNRNPRAAAYWARILAAKKIPAGLAALKNLANLDPNIQWENHRQRASVGKADSQYMMGLLYENGNADTQLDLQVAFRWFQAAAQQAYPPALLKLGEYYELGIATGRNFTQARSCYNQAAAQKTDPLTAGLANRQLAQLDTREKDFSLMIKQFS